MKHIKKLLALLLALLTVITATAIAIPAVTADDGAAEGEATLPTPLLITEVCFNPTFMEHDQEDLVSKTTDVLEFVEVYNASNEAVSLKDAVLRYGKNGYEGEFLENSLVAVSTSDMTVAPRETAIICIYGGDAATLGLTYDSDEGIAKLFEVFSQVNVNLSDTVTVEDFIIAPKTVSGTSDKVSDQSFNLANSTTDAVVRVVSVSGDTEALLCETHYNAELWNRNACSVNMLYDPAVEPEHPNATVPFNSAYPTPGYLFDNQYPDAVLAADGATEGLTVMEYNICATDSTQTPSDGSVITIGQRMDKLEEMLTTYAPDVVGLPEFNDLWLPEMKAYLAGEDCAYTAFGCSSQGKEFGKRDTNYTWDLINLILYDKNKYDLVEEGYFWCSARPDRHNSYTWEDGTVGDFARCINWVILKNKETGAEFFFACAHIDAKVPLARTYSTALITQKATELSGGRPVIMVGDWNCHESTEAYWNLHQNGYSDARYRTDSVADMQILGTYNKWGANDDLQTRPPIDHCVVSEDSVTVNSVKTDMGYLIEDEKIYASDHNATLFDLSYVNINAEKETEAETTVTDVTVTDVTTEPVTDASKGEQGTASDTTTEEVSHETPTGGCASMVSVFALLAVLTAGAVLMKKKEY